MVNSLKNIILELEDYCSGHPQINEFGFGSPSNISTKNQKFVLVWLTPTSSIIDGKMLTIKFDMYIMDIVKQDNSNLKDVISDTLLIGNDIVTNFWYNENYKWSINEKNVSSEPFEANFDDYCAGWIFSISVELENDLNVCDLP